MKRCRWAFNDVDLCIKVRRLATRIVWTPCVEMFHHESLTLGHHDFPERREQFRHDMKTIRERWKDVLDADPCYNPNLSLTRAAAFSLAWPPRLPYGAQLQTISIRAVFRNLAAGCGRHCRTAHSRSARPNARMAFEKTVHGRFHPAEDSPPQAAENTRGRPQRADVRHSIARTQFL